jgi:hypothetical protein
MPDTTPNLGLSYMLASQADKHVTFNASLSALDVYVQARAKSRTISSQPASPVEGDAYILPPGKSGTNWSGFSDHALAVWQDGVWRAFDTKIGQSAFVLDEANQIIRQASGWAVAGANQKPISSVETFLNGSFAIWQRGTSATLTATQSTYLADRWRHEAGIGGAASLSRINLMGGSTGLPEWAQFGLRHNQTTSATSPPRIEQRVEGLPRFSGNTLSVSAYMRVQSGTAVITPRAISNYGVGGSSATSLSAPAWTVTSTWKRFVATFAIPSIGAIANLDVPTSFLAIGFDLPTGSARICLLN